MPGESEWIKTLVLLSDGFGILLPNYARGKPEQAGPSIPLGERRAASYTRRCPSYWRSKSEISVNMSFRMNILEGGLL